MRMNSDTVFIYSGALYCKECGESIRAELQRNGLDLDEFPGDLCSETAPQPWPPGGSDSLNYCDSGEHCPGRLSAGLSVHGSEVFVGALLPVNLTGDGVRYEAESIRDALGRDFGDKSIPESMDEALSEHSEVRDELVRLLVDEAVEMVSDVLSGLVPWARDEFVDEFVDGLREAVDERLLR